MRIWFLAVTVAAIGLTAKPALASYACGPWGNDEVRCIGNNGIAHDQLRGLSGRYYFVSAKHKPTVSGDYSFSVDVWRSMCGLPGTHVSAGKPQFRTSSEPAFETAEYAGSMQCVEFFFHKCKIGGSAVSCADILAPTIEAVEG